MFVIALSACEPSCLQSVPDGGPVDAGFQVDGGPDAGEIADGGRLAPDAGCRASDAGPLSFAPAFATESHIVFEPASDAGVAAPSLAWRSSGRCDAFPNARLSDSLSGVVTELATISQSGESYFVGTLVQRMPWTASVLGEDMAAVVAINALTGEVGACVPLPEPPPQTGDRGAIEIVASDKTVIISVSEGWSGEQGDEAAYECPECEVTRRRVLWRFDGTDLVKLHTTDSSGSGGLILPIGGQRFLSVEGRSLRLFSFEGQMLWDGQVDSDLLSTCFGQKKIVFARVAESGNLLLTVRETWPNDELVELSPNGDASISLTPFSQQVTLGEGSDVAVTNATGWTSTVGDLTCASKSRTFADGVFCARQSFETAPGTLVALTPTGVQDVATIDAEASIFDAVSSGRYFLAVHSKGDLSRTSFSVATESAGVLGTIELTAIASDIPPYVVDGGVLVQLGDGLVRISHPGFTHPDSRWPRGLLLGGNTNSGALSPSP